MNKPQISDLEEVRLVRVDWEESAPLNVQEYVALVKADYADRKVLSPREQEHIANAAQEWQALEPRLWRLINPPKP